MSDWREALHTVDSMPRLLPDDGAPTCDRCGDNCFLRTEAGVRRLVCPRCLWSRVATPEEAEAIMDWGAQP